MSNIHTAAIRVCARPGSAVSPAEAEWITRALLGGRGSYWVPVWTRRHPEGRYADVQFGSGKGSGAFEFWEEHGARYRTMWVRFSDEGWPPDWIWQDDAYGSRRPCRYGFDEVRVATALDQPPVAPDAPWRWHPDGTWRLPVRGSYLTGNCRSASVGRLAAPGDALPAPDPSALPTPTTPNELGEPLEDLDPPWLAPLADEHPSVTLIEYRWRGRLVHRARHEPDPDLGPSWQHRSADDWDNCVDGDFLRCGCGCGCGCGEAGLGG